MTNSKASEKFLINKHNIIISYFLQAITPGKPIWHVSRLQIQQPLYQYKENASSSTVLIKSLSYEIFPNFFRYINHNRKTTIHEQLQVQREPYKFFLY